MRKIYNKDNQYIGQMKEPSFCGEWAWHAYIEQQPDGRVKWILLEPVLFGLDVFWPEGAYCYLEEE